ncbi:heterokaryon incompatibility protein-domain-containing protein [Dichomitus squalens]|uniref:Heterokaryon incompatibility protein-domain-containing protein n=1 Tax=Dichomitus squalens TaxID=114155 RepID=A0A4V2K066_9APHY|nr:heterokaryon incompatibility protein-domain-containing protein [Dichomitus squalens]
MTCFPPLCRPVSRYVRGLFMRAKRHHHAPECPASTSKADSSMTMLPSGVLVREKVPISAIDVHSSPQSLVCQFCWDTGLFAAGPFQEAWDGQASFYGTTYTTTWTQIQSSADNDCQWCKLVLSTRTDIMLQETLQITVGFRPTSGSHAVTPKGVHTLRLVVDDMPHFMYYVYAKQEDPAASLLVARPRVLQLNSPSTRAMASSCITDCIRKHTRCPPPHNATLPSRVIDCSDPTKPKLRLSGGDTASYVILSYVCGEDQPYRTTTANLDSYLLGIDLAALPQTIKDAIETTHNFGVRYLWLNALCILQDSEEDIAREIGQMRTVFRGAYFTIIAASASTASQGFLQDRPPPSPPDVTLPFRCPDGEVGTMFLSPVWRQYDGSAEPVHQDALCLQERLLSPRALVYASHTLQFHCQTSIVNVGNSVCGPTFGARLPDLLLRPDAELPSGSPSMLSQSERKTLQWSWIETVGDYTHRTVAKPDDKLVAFASIAELFHRAWKTDYLAGLWRDTLTQDLLWYKTFETRYPRPETFRAPSWSWAAIDGRVMAYSVDDRLDPDSKDTEACEVVSCEVAVATPLLPFGKVRSGTLTLRSVMLEATWNPDSSMPDLYLKTSDAASDSTVNPVSSDPPEITTEPRHIGCAYPDSTEDVQEVWAIPIQWNQSARYASGLIVAPHPDGGNAFRRVGFFHSPEDTLEGLMWMLNQEKRDILLV